VNNVVKGDFIAYLTAEADFLIRPVELAELGLLHTRGKSVRVGGEEHVSLRSIAGIDIRFDENTLTLSLQVPASMLEAQSLNFGAALPTTPIWRRAPGGFLNYRLGYAQSEGLPASWNATTELGVNIGELLLLDNHTFNTPSDQARSVRLQTQLVFDQPDDMRRWIAGDSFASSGELGSSLNLGGIGVSKLYQINPYFIRTPLASYAGSAAQSSTVDIYVDGVRVRSEQVAPGNFNLQNLSGYSATGLRNVEVVVRDPFGREQRIGFPFFFTDQLLAEGLSEYSYNAGQMRKNFGQKSADYGAFAVSAFHRYGVTDALTVGLGGDATREHINIGPRLTFNTVAAGVISAIASFSHDRGIGSLSRSGNAVSLAHTFQSGAFSSQVLLRRYSEDYSVIGITPLQPPKLQGAASVSYGSSNAGTASLAYDVHTSYGGIGDQRTTTLGYSKTLLGNFSLVINVSRNQQTNVGYGAFIGLSYYPANGIGVTGSHQRSRGGNNNGNNGANNGGNNDGNSTDQLKVSKAPPIGEGLGYRVFAERSVTSGVASHSVSPFVQYNARAAIVTAESTSFNSAGGSNVGFRQVSVAGAMAVLDNGVYFSRPIDDSYAVARVEPPLAGLRVTKSSADIGVTGVGGDVFIPGLGSYQVNDVGIKGKDLPLDYIADHLAQRVRPAYRSGAVVVFPITRIRAVTGSIKLRDGDKVSAIENAVITLNGAVGKISLATIRNGDFYLENLAPGSYAAQPQIGKRTCRLTFTVADSREIVANLGDIYCEIIP
jgi:outer membrane usher protein FimD/PapC